MMANIDRNRADSKKGTTDQTRNENVPTSAPLLFSIDVSKKKSKVAIELEEKRMREQILEELECQKQFKAHGVPEFVSAPLYDQLVKREEEKKMLLKEKSKERFKDLVKPFSFSGKQKDELKTSNLKSTDKIVFKANPFPTKLFTLDIDNKIQEIEAKRALAKKLRSKALLKNSETPKAIVEHSKKIDNKKTCVNEVTLNLIQKELTKFNPKIHRDVPNFDQLYTKFINKKFKDNENFITKCEPFHFETELRNKQLKNNERRVLSASSNNLKTQNMRRSSSASLLPSSMDTIPTVATKTSILRAQKARMMNEQAKQYLEFGLKQLQIKKSQNQILHKSVREKSMIYDVNFVRTSIEDKIKQQKNAEKERMKQYKKELSVMQRRIVNRPLLFEQVAEINAKHQAMKEHNEILEKNKINMFYLQKNYENTTTDAEKNKDLSSKPNDTITFENEGVDNYEEYASYKPKSSTEIKGEIKEPSSRGQSMRSGSPSSINRETNEVVNKDSDVKVSTAIDSPTQSDTDQQLNSPEASDVENIDNVDGMENSENLSDDDYTNESFNESTNIKEDT